MHSLAMANAVLQNRGMLNNREIYEKWMVLDDQYFTFENMTRVYSVLDLLKVA